MPKQAFDPAEQLYARSLVLGDPKVGKTTSLIKGCVGALGPGYVMCCSTEGHLASAKIEVPAGWEYDVIKTKEQMDAAIKTYREGVKSGAYRWGLLDDFNLFAMRLEEDVLSQGGYTPTLYHQLRQMLVNYVLRLCDVKAHLFCSMHYYEENEEIEKGKPRKTGRGIIPLMPGKAKQVVPAQFNQVIWMQKNKAGERVFHCNPEGVWGAGSQGLPKGTNEIPADVGLLIKLLGFQQKDDAR